MKEVWKKVVGASDYEISNLGRVRSNRRTDRGFTDYIMKPKTDKGGYLTIPSMYKDDGSVKTVKIHRLVAESFIENKYNLPQVNHIDGDKTNNSVSNLEWCTAKENFKHAKNNGLRPTGEEHGRHKLTWNDVRYIRKYCVKGSKEYGVNALGKKLGVTPRVITLILRNEIWREI